MIGITKFGPAKLLNFLSEEERTAFQQSEYVSVCHLCFEIFKDLSRHQKLDRLLEEWYQDRVSFWMPSLTKEIAKFEDLL